MRILPRRYLPLLTLLAATWMLSLGPGLYDPVKSAPDMAGLWQGITEVGVSEPYHWNYMVFSGVCHSKPDRSFSLAGVQMAVNSRCSGFFTGLLLGAMLLPMMAFLPALVMSSAAQFMFSPKKWVLSSLGILLAMQLLDVMGNMSGLWSNTLWSRFWLGFPLGVALVLSIAEVFVRPPSR